MHISYRMEFSILPFFVQKKWEKIANFFQFLFLNKSKSEKMNGYMYDIVWIIYVILMNIINKQWSTKPNDYYES